MINDDYIERRHAERVLEEELNTRGKPVWYLPHYPVKHPLKPGKGEAGSWLCRKVWINITSSWWHRSNVSPIHGGPKRLWHLLNLKRFLWWPNRDLAKEMQDYRMVKHLFGATSSPSVANFYPRKAPQLNQEGVRKVNLGPKSRRGNCLVFSHASYDPVKRSMYEDDKNVCRCHKEGSHFSNSTAQVVRGRRFSLEEVV